MIFPTLQRPPDRSARGNQPGRPLSATAGRWRSQVRLGRDLLMSVGRAAVCPELAPAPGMLFAHDDVQECAERQQDTEDDGDGGDEWLTGNSDLSTRCRGRQAG